MSLIRCGYRRSAGYLLVLILVAVFGVTAQALAAIARIAPPTGFTAVAGDGRVTLSWTRAAGSTGVDIIRNGAVFAEQVPGRRWTTEVVRNGATYKYALRSVNAKGSRSAKSATRTVTPQAPPPALNGVAVRNQNRQVTLTWKPPNNTIAATVQARVDGVPARTAKASAGVLTIGNLVNGKTYLITLGALNRNGTAGKMVQVTVIPTEEDQRSPFGLTVTAGAGRVDLSWQPVAGAQRYQVYRNGTMISTIAAPGRTAADTGLTNNVTYRYHARVVVSGQLSGPSPTKVATPLAIPAAPDPVTAQPRDGAVLLSWPEPVDPVAMYEVYRNNTKVAEVPGTSLNHIDSILVNKKAYRYQLLPYNANKAAGPRSAVVTAVPGPAPGAPAAPSATAGDSKITLSWPAGDTGRWLLLRDGTTLGGVLTAPGFVDTSAVNDITYRYALLVVGADQQWSLPSPAVTATPRAIPPNPPTGLQAVAGNTEVTLTWDMPLSAAARYRVYRDGTRVAEVAASPAHDGALDNDTTYEYWVTALDARGVESASSARVPVRPTPPAEDAPTVTVAGQHEAAQLTFTAPQGRTVAQWRVLRDGVEITRTTQPTDTDRQLTDGRPYRYQVQSVYDDGSVSPLSTVAVAVPRAPWQSVSVGTAFACAVHVTGTVRCWGANDSRQLGDLSTVGSAAAPVVVTGPSGVTQVAAGSRQACAVAHPGVLWCWGGVLGKPDQITRPVVVAGLSGVTAVDSDGGTTCAVAGGTVWCLGDGSRGQLGGPASSTDPVKISLPDTATAVTVGGGHACALLADATIVCWGADEHGQRSGTPSAARTPARVAGLTGVSAVSAGTDHTCVQTGITVSCFGADDVGQLGRTATASGRPAPVIVPAANAVSAGNRYTCVTLLSGQARCFGAGRAGQLGDGAGLNWAVPMTVLNLDTATSVATAGGTGATTCALTRDGSLWCFGANGSGQLGAGADSRSSRPSEPIAGLVGTTRIALGTDAGCVIRDSAVWCWGDNRWGAAGGVAGVPAPHPIRILLPDGVKPRTVVVGTGTSCVLSEAAEAYCWGANGSGQAGQPAAPTVAPALVPIKGASEIAVGDQVTCVRRANGSLWCFGRADLLGAGLTEKTPNPGPVQVVDGTGRPLTRISQVAVGPGHVCATERYIETAPASGGMWCFGTNSDGQLGTAGGTAPVARRVPGLSGVIAVGAGRAHTCAVALLPARALWCFGANESGQLGLGDLKGRTMPTLVVGVKASRLAVAGDLTCVKSPNPQGWCFGAGADGQTGNGLLRAGEPLAQVLYDRDGILLVAQLATNGTTSCAARVDGAVTCWGARTLTSFGEGPVLSYPDEHVVD
ncbi:hypothetical protein [Actinoplanes derwentensis]|uniref:Alpha-tubulin suppressor n=1 Tax=Actinoplanes derwentensis TaxID=113562 RepID=A0A1H1R1W9_9ACTN|nr:hypothetical protein [Actinoplanes derwentensis]GID90503.1 hypothetical protein Ade03nite_94270 [Actinoplanes derwentensis]SDS29738.1 Alpha-tubulin suppressor [Actinoplanes derwentensis]